MHAHVAARVRVRAHTLKHVFPFQKSLDPSVKSVILDGEICAFNHQTETLTQKGEQMSIRNIKPDDPMFQQCFYAYDIVHLNGKVLTNKPLTERIQILKSILR